MPKTPNVALRYPTLGDAPNVPLDLQRLAEDADAAIADVRADLTAPKLDARQSVQVLAAITPVAATAWGTTYGAALDVTLARPQLVRIDASGWVTATGADCRSRIQWTGAATGNTFDYLNGWGGVMYLALPAGATSAYHSVSLGFDILLPAGTTTFRWEAYKGSTAASPSVNYAQISAQPVALATAF